MSATKCLNDLVGKTVHLVLEGSSYRYRILAIDAECGFIKVQIADSEGPATNWYPLSKVEAIEEEGH